MWTCLRQRLSLSQEAETSLEPSKIGTLVLDFQTPEKGTSGKVQGEHELCEKRGRREGRARSRGQEGKGQKKRPVTKMIGLHTEGQPSCVLNKGFTTEL